MTLKNNAQLVTSHKLRLIFCDFFVVFFILRILRKADELALELELAQGGRH